MIKEKKCQKRRKKTDRKVGKLAAVLLQLCKKNGCSRGRDVSVGYKLRGLTEIETEEYIDKGNPFSPDTGFHTDAGLLSRSIHLRHNASVSSAHTTLNTRYSL